MGLRVVDEQQIDRHYSADQLKDLYKFTPAPSDDKPRLAPPKDQILGEMILGSKTKSWVVNYHMHDSLLEHKPEESLTKEEIDKAWEEYENEKKGIYTRNPNAGFGNMGNMGYGNYNNMHQSRHAGIETSNWVNALGVSCIKLCSQFNTENLITNLADHTGQHCAYWKGSFRIQIQRFFC